MDPEPKKGAVREIMDDLRTELGATKQAFKEFFPSLTKDVWFAAISHIAFILIYLLEVRTNPLLFATPFGIESAAVFLAVCEILIMVSTTRRLGLLQATGVIATSYALVLSLSYQGAGALQSALGKASVMVVSALVFRFLEGRWLSRKGAFWVAFYLGLQTDLIVYALGVGLPLIILPSIYIEGLMFISFVLGSHAIDWKRFKWQSLESGDTE